jgi:hypothetical protein
METSRRKRTWTPRRGGDSRGVKEGGRPAGRQARGRGQSSRTRNPITARQQRERYPAGPALSLFGFPPPRDCRLPSVGPSALALPFPRRPFRACVPFACLVVSGRRRPAGARVLPDATITNATVPRHSIAAVSVCCLEER